MTGTSYAFVSIGISGCHLKRLLESCRAKPSQQGGLSRRALNNLQGNKALHNTLGSLVGCVTSCLAGCTCYHKLVTQSVQRHCQKHTVRARPPPPHKGFPSLPSAVLLQSPQEDAKTKVKQLEKLRPLTLTSRELQQHSSDTGAKTRSK